MELRKCIILSLKISYLLSVFPLLTANPLKGKFYPIGPGTDAGLYNEGFFEGDILPKLDVSTNKIHSSPMSLYTTLSGST
jgi:hypothetical protein